MIRTAEAVIDLTALSHNLSEVRQAAVNSRIMAVIKANAYGHGMLEVAQALSNTDAFAVSCVREGVELRNAGIQLAINILQGFSDEDELLQCLRYELIPVIHQSWQIDLLSTCRLSSGLPVWLKVSTGMNRLGFAQDDFVATLARLQSIQQVSILGYMTHFANADYAFNTADPRHGFTGKQLERFKGLIEGYQGETTAANSAALLACPESQLDWVRPGLLLYGANPFGEDAEMDFPFKPVMTLKSRLIAINQCRQGDAIGYGSEWVCPHDMSIGVVAIGYADGYPRNIAQGTPVMIADQFAPIVGRVSMDMMTIDISHIKNAKIGDDIILWGSKLPVERIAAAAGTISYELLCGVYGRVQFRYMEGHRG